LSEQLKAVKKRTRVYEAEIKYLKTVAMTKIDRDVPTPASLKRDDLSAKMQVGNNAMPPTSSMNSEKGKIEHVGALTEKYVLELEEVAAATSVWDKCLENSLLLQFQDVMRRRAASTVRSLRNRKHIEKFGGKEGEGGVPSSVKHEIPVLNGVTGLGLEHFADADKYKAVVHFLSEPLVFEEVRIDRNFILFIHLICSMLSIITGCKVSWD
jgi:hypothetical protein